MDASGIKAYVSSHQAVDISSDAGDSMSKGAYGLPKRRVDGLNHVLVPVTSTDGSLGEKDKESYTDTESIRIADDQTVFDDRMPRRL